MYVASSQGQTTPGDKILMSTETTCHFGHMLQVQKNLFEVGFYTFFFMILYMYIAPGQGLTTPWGWNFDVNWNIFSLWSFVANLKTNLFEVWFLYNFFHDLIHVYRPGAGADIPQGQGFDFNRNILSLHSFVANFKRRSLKSLFIQFFSWFNTCI